MSRRSALVASCLTAVLVASIVALPAVSAPSALTVARQALTLAKKADARSKQALAKAGKTGPAGPAGPAGPQGPQGSKGADGINGTNGGNGTNGTNGSTLVPQNGGPGLPSHNSTPQSIPVTVSANRGGLVGINVTVFPLAAGCGGSSMQFDLYFDEQNAAHRLLSQSFAPGAAQTVLTANAYVGKKATSSSHNVIMTLSDNCPPNPMSGTLGSVNAQVDLVEFAP